MRGLRSLLKKFSAASHAACLLAPLLLLPLSCNNSQPASVVSGEITVNNQPMEGVMVFLTHPRFGTVPVRTDSNGVFIFPGAWGGTCTVTPRLEGYTFSPETRIIDTAIAPLARLHFTTVVTWARTYGGMNDECANSVRETADGGYIAAGYVNSDGVGNYDFILKKLDLYGIEEWSRTYGGGLNDVAYSVVQTADGGYIIAGGAETVTDSGQVYIVKTGADGAVEWERTYGGPDWDVARSIRQTADGGYIVAGYSDSTALSSIRVLRLDADGDSIWERTYGGVDFDRAYAVEETADGGFIVAGATEFFSTGCSQMCLLKLYSNGDEEWTKRYATGDRNEARDIMNVATNGTMQDFAVAGFAEWDASGSSGILVKGLDGDGTELWAGPVGPGSYCRAYSIDRTGDGGYILTGYQWSDDYDSRNILLVKVDGRGTTIWTREFNGLANGPDEAYEVRATSDGGYIIAGKAWFEDTKNNMAIIKTDGYGEISGVREGIE